MMEIPPRQIYSAQGDRRTSFQLPVSKGTVLPPALRQPEPNSVVDSYLGVGKVRASSANPAKRTIGGTRSSIDMSGGQFRSQQQQQQFSLEANLAQMQLAARQQQGYDQMKAAAAQKMSYLSEIMATKPPMGARNVSSAGGMGSAYGVAPSPRAQQFQQQLRQDQQAMLGITGSNGSASRASGYHVMTPHGAGEEGGGGSNPLLSCSMPLPKAASTGFNSSRSADCDVVSILSTSSASRKGGALSRGQAAPKKRVRFAERIAVYAKDSDFEASPTPIYANGKIIINNNSSNGSNSGVVGVGASNTPGGIAGISVATLTSFMHSQQAAASGSAAPVLFTANLSTGTLTYNESPVVAPSSSLSAAPVSLANKYSSAHPAYTAVQTVQNTLNNQALTAAPTEVHHAPTLTPVVNFSKFPNIGGAKRASPPTVAPLLEPPEPSQAQPSALASIATTPGAESQQVASQSQAAGPTTAAPSSSAKGSSGSDKGKKAKPVRPSLSEQLASIGAKAEALTSDIRIKGKLEATPSGAPSSSGDAALYTMPARCFSIGSLSCRFPSPIHFFGDRLEYVFNHPFEATAINMVLFYRDMSAISILGTKFKFKLPKRLALFLTDFDPQNPHHVIAVELSSMLSVSVVREKVLPIISTFK